MSRVKRGDIIFHVFNRTIHAVSVAKFDAYTYPKPPELSKTIWNDDGWRVDCDMIMINQENAILLDDYQRWFDSHKGEVFDKIGRLKEQYLFQLNEDQKNFLVNLLPRKLIQSLLLDDTEPNVDSMFSHLEKVDVESARGVSLVGASERAMHRIDHSFKVSHVKDEVGKLGERLVFKYLRHVCSNKYQIIPISSNLAGNKGDDTAGYDLKLIGKQTIIYIDVKTTTGSDGPFYMSANEKRVLDMVASRTNEIYEIYRVFNLSKTGEGVAKFEIIREKDLNNANFQPEDYFVSLR
ncbi:protein NO VEIN domain-containing protein [Lentilactobacillus raoultii]|uniref:Protein NO VEIN domain-containing protein n=1 Tax=Lentilactobacillus raoultii TaxID=1987503 RepID=A0ABW3PER0_9LACO|nr:DUF3883 domain-containing protein [Lentilactobacillus raoultii]